MTLILIIIHPLNHLKNYHLKNNRTQASKESSISQSNIIETVRVESFRTYSTDFCSSKGSTLTLGMGLIGHISMTKSTIYYGQGVTRVGIELVVSGYGH